MPAPDITSESQIRRPPAESNGLALRCWGTRGSIPSPGPATAGYGGNTPCIEVRVGSQRLVFDAGSGMRLLGMHLIEKDAPLETSIFLSHFHWDHIQGFPFFAPLYHPEARLRIIGPQQDGVDAESLFAGQMGPIYFPVPFAAVSAACTFEHLNEGRWQEGEVVVDAMRMRHASFTVGYRLRARGKTVCYVPDNELAGGSYPVGEDWRDELVDFIGDADLLFHDSMYTDDEYAAKEGWGHSTFRQTLDLAREAGVKQLHFFHHAPERSDHELDQIVARMREEAASAAPDLKLEAAAEGSDLDL